MNPRSAPTGATETSESVQPVVLRGCRLFAARLVLIALAALSVGLFVASVTVAYAQFHTPCGGAECRFPGGWLSPTEVRALEELGLSLDFYAAYKVVLGTAWTLGCWAIGAILFWKRSNGRLALFASIAFVSLGAANVEFYIYLWYVYPKWHLAIGLVSFVGNVSFFVLWCLFPDGRFVPRWTRWVAAAFVPTQLYHSFFVWSLYYSSDFHDSPFSPRYWPAWIAVSLRLVLVGSLVVAQIYRYRRVSGPVARQQTKWVVFGFAVSFVSSVGVAIILGVDYKLSFPYSPNLVYELAVPLTYLVGLLVPLSFAVGILRYRLWDIDVIINRTLVYGSLTTVLAAVFAITDTLLLPLLVRSVLGEDDPSLNAVVSALIIAVIFEPLRRRIKAGVNDLTDWLVGGGGTSESAR